MTPSFRYFARICCRGYTTREQESRATRCREVAAMLGLTTAMHDRRNPDSAKVVLLDDMRQSDWARLVTASLEAIVDGPQPVQLWAFAGARRRKKPTIYLLYKRPGSRSVPAGLEYTDNTDAPRQFLDGCIPTAVYGYRPRDAGDEQVPGDRPRGG